MVSTDGRNKFWHNTVAKYGFAAVKIVDGLTNEESLEIEKQYIAKYGLRIEGGGLVNLTYGGSGGRTCFDHNIESIRRKCRDGKIGERNPNYGKKTWNTGKPMSLEQKEKLRRKKTGTKLSPETKIKVLIALNKARESRNLCKVQCLITGRVWNNRSECISELGITRHVFGRRIRMNKPIKNYHLQLIKTQ